VSKFLFHFRQGGPFDEARFLRGGNARFEDDHLLLNDREFIEQRFESVGSEVHFLDQSDSLVAAANKAFPSVASFSSWLFAIDCDVEIGVISHKQVSEGFDIWADAAHDRDFFGRIGNAHFDGSVKSQLAVPDLFEKFCRSLKHEIRSEHPSAIEVSGAIDVFCSGDFLVPRQQWDFTHLHQVHPDGVFGRIYDFVVIGEEAIRVVIAEFIFGRECFGRDFRIVGFEGDTARDCVGESVEQFAIFFEKGFLSGNRFIVEGLSGGSLSHSSSSAGGKNDW